jgi:UDP-N-acetylglucosamine:LPS N-acetylglucosamine transferase
MPTSSPTPRSPGSDPKARRILAAASGGGHWIQLLRLRPAFADQKVTFVTVQASYRVDLRPGERLRVVPDANLSSKLMLLWLALRMLWVVVTERPHVVISTGAAPGYFAIRFGRWLGARTVWVDSIANAEELSVSGARIRGHADLVLSQWPHVAEANGVEYAGSVL